MQPRQHAEQTQPADRSPLNKFDMAIGGIRVRRDEHRAAGVLAVIESQEKRAPLAPFLTLIAANREAPPAQPPGAVEHGTQPTKVPGRTEPAIAHRADVHRQTNASPIGVTDSPAG